jgi:perosamine synthetase
VDAIPVNSPEIGATELRAVLECLESGWLSSEGPQVAQFERVFSQAVHRNHGIAVSSGTAALDIAVRALGLGPGDEVLVPSLTIISCARAIVESGAKPVPVDCSPTDWNAHLADFERWLTPRTKAVMLVHLYGLCADLDPIIRWTRARNLAIIEDASQAHGLCYKGRPCGSFGDISVFSLYANKLITTGEGGMIVCDAESLAERCRSLRNLCFDPARRFWHEELGWNYRMTAIQAALGIPQVKRLAELAARKRALGEVYRAGLEGLTSFEMAPSRTAYAENVYWVFALVVCPECGFSREDATAALGRQGIGTRPFFYGLHEQPVLRERALVDPVTLPETESLARRGFYLPSGLGLSRVDQDRVIGALRTFVEAGR